MFSLETKKVMALVVGVAVTGGLLLFVGELAGRGRGGAGAPPPPRPRKVLASLALAI